MFIFVTFNFFRLDQFICQKGHPHIKWQLAASSKVHVSCNIWLSTACTLLATTQWDLCLEFWCPCWKALLFSLCYIYVVQTICSCRVGVIASRVALVWLLAPPPPIRLSSGLLVLKPASPLPVWVGIGRNQAFVLWCHRANSFSNPLPLGLGWKSLWSHLKQPSLPWPQWPLHCQRVQMW